MNTNEIDDVNRLWVTCPICATMFALVWNNPIKNTLFVGSSHDDGVYSVSVRCPDCVWSAELE